jgi:hypothetical protein
MIAVQGYTRVWLRFKHWPEQAYSFFKRLFPRAEHSARHGQRATRADHIYVSLLQENKSGLQFCVVDSVAALNGDKRIFVFSADMSTSEPQHLMSVELRQFTKRTNN